MPEKPLGKGKKLPVWAYFVAAAIGVLIVFFLFRKKPGGSSDLANAVTPAYPPTGAGAYGSDYGFGDPSAGGDDGGGGGGGGTGGCIPFRKPCTPAGPLAESPCCTGNCSFNTRLCVCHANDWACKAEHPEHYRNHPGKPHSRFEPATAHGGTTLNAP